MLEAIWNKQIKKKQGNIEKVTFNFVMLDMGFRSLVGEVMVVLCTRENIKKNV